MPHPLEKAYGLTATELLEALARRFRAKVALEGAVAEVHMERKFKAAQAAGALLKYQIHDEDGHPDFSIWLRGREKALLAECKTVRDSNEAYRSGGKVTAYKVETQKTRASQGDPSSRFYGADQFAILGVCLGKKTGRWDEFVFIRSSKLARHRSYPKKLAVMHRVPLPEVTNVAPWFRDIGELLRTFR
jgi:hypothetical protein